MTSDPGLSAVSGDAKLIEQAREWRAVPRDVLDTYTLIDTLAAALEERIAERDEALESAVRNELELRERLIATEQDRDRLAVALEQLATESTEPWIREYVRAALAELAGKEEA